MKLDAMQAALREAGLDGWLFYDHHGRDPLAYGILGLDATALVTRRWFYFVPAEGAPRKLNHRIEAERLAVLPGARAVYSSWREMESELAGMLGGAERVAMQYSPRNAVPAVGMVDAGTVEMVRGMGVEVVTSADLVSRFYAVLSEAQVASHFVAQRKVDAILEAGWRWVGERVRSGARVNEWAAVRWLQEQMEREGIAWEHAPNVSVGANSADSHYEPVEDGSAVIERGSFVLIDIWGKVAGDADAIFYDITWTGVVGSRTE